ncbi:septum formation initiator family protein [Flavobacteriaceae bacterium]|mgnify:FL=1|jgi:cell division protein DivIC|nr:septum formation initiator [Flavobacteriaceae bacterium]MCP4803077.1 septum formation initiator family protein [Bacteroidota bacterium]MDA9552367.1 septum formation initiator family protein [Flavobacteriaceae bacterium]MDC0957739.1 septum formation initiator family protein [Flavobacteriaceae bacterium]MDC3242635.1 septum formation initiator family protein [Flavobacteriaceae bacterium]
MTFFNSKYKFLFRPFKNIFLLISLVFLIWMLFFDSNSWMIHHELNQDLKKLEDEKNYYNQEIKKDLIEIKKLSSDEGLEKFAREEYHMKKSDEDIYIIEYEDSIRKQKGDD